MVDKKLLRAPAGLAAQGRRFWKKVQAELGLEDAHDKARLFMACRCLDDIAVAEKAVELDGRFFQNTKTGVMKEHPAAKAVRESRVLFCRIVRELGLDLADPEDPRPPRQY